MTFARALVLGLEGYLVAGLLFGLWFAWRGAERLDPGARSGTLGFRLLLLPGCAALWPWLVLRVALARREAHA